jgi:hypothetical protein
MVHELTRQTQIERFIADYDRKVRDIDFLIERNKERIQRFRKQAGRDIDSDLLIEKHKLDAQRQAYVQAMKDFESLLDLD